MREFRSVNDVVQWRACVGCGACAYICPDRRIRLVDYIEEGIRPVVKEGDCSSCRDCLDVCPSVAADFRLSPTHSPNSADFESLKNDWGCVLGLWEGHAADHEIRHQGASGGALTALAAYCIEQLGMFGVLHIAGDPQDPVRNRTVLSRSRSALLKATGSRYSPASVCNGLDLVEQAPAPCAIIGRPAEIAALRNAARLRPNLQRNIGIALSFFCAETPSTGGTLALLQEHGIKPEEVAALRYRGLGWPGHFAVRTNEGSGFRPLKTYSQSWSFLQRHRPWSAHLWPDGSGELADISCGDPWYSPPDGKNLGKSLVVARSTIGQEIVIDAIRAGYLELSEAEPWKLERSQRGLQEKRGASWGRRLALSVAGIPVTRFEGMPLFRSWLRLSPGGQFRSIFGTLRRVISRRLYVRQSFDNLPNKEVPLPAEVSE